MSLTCSRSFLWRTIVFLLAFNISGCANANNAPSAPVDQLSLPRSDGLAVEPSAVGEPRSMSPPPPVPSLHQPRAKSPPKTLAQTTGEEGSGVAPTPAPTVAPAPRGCLPTVAPAPAAAPAPTVAPAIPSDRKVKVALLLPLSGKDAALGRGLLNAAIMAVFDFGDQRLVLQPYDTEGPGGARASAQRALSEEAGLIIGPFFGRQIAEVAELAARRNVNLISFSNDSSVAGSNAFVFGISPAQSLGRVLDFAASKSIMTYATLLPDDSYGRLIAEIVKTQVREAKGSILRSTFYSPNESNYSEAVKSVAEFDERRRGVAAFLKNQGADPLAPPTPARSKDALKRAQKLTTTREVDYQALVLSESGQRLLNLASLIPYYAINTQKVKIIGLNSNLDDRNLLTEPALNGAWFAAPDPSGRREFDKKYAGLFGADAPRLSSLCYDLIGLAAVLARRSESGDFSTATLRSRDGFIGIDGIFRFTPNNTAERGLAILEIQRGGPVVIAKAPTKFSN